MGGKKEVWGCVFLGLWCLLQSVFAGSIQEDPPTWWEIKLRLLAQGGYSVKSSDAKFDGEYIYEVAWTGGIERDDVDYLLYHVKLETLRWELREKNQGADAEIVLTEKDMPVKPVFRMNYILNENGRLQFNFEVEGFSVPLGASKEKFTLPLPRVKKDDQDLTFPPYDASIIKGSNDISIPERELLKAPLMRTFRWTWKRYLAPNQENGPPPLVNTHQAEVKIVITPHN